MKFAQRKVVDKPHEIGGGGRGSARKVVAKPTKRAVGDAGLHWKLWKNSTS